MKANQRKTQNPSKRLVAFVYISRQTLMLNIRAVDLVSSVNHANSTILKLPCSLCTLLCKHRMLQFNKSLYSLTDSLAALSPKTNTAKTQPKNKS